MIIKLNSYDFRSPEPPKDLTTKISEAAALEISAGDRRRLIYKEVFHRLRLVGLLPKGKVVYAEEFRAAVRETFQGSTMATYDVSFLTKSTGLLLRPICLSVRLCLYN